MYSKYLILIVFFFTATFADGLDTAKVIHEISRTFTKHYVFPDVAKKMEAKLQSEFKNGAYDLITDPSVLASRIQEDLIAVSQDLHISVRYERNRPTSLLQSPGDKKQVIQEMERRNFNLQQLQILDGNVGYFKMNGFPPAELAGHSITAAMNFLSRTDALIFDLRHNGGGSPSAVQLISSYLFEKPIHLNSFYVKATGEMDQFWTSAYVSGPRYINKPVFVLTSGATFSAAEEFSYNLKNLKRATLVGETTGGGAHPVNSHYLESIKFSMMIPYGRAINPITKSNWEGVGVEPHVKVPAAKAFQTAHTLAIDEITKASKNENHRKFLSWTLEGLKVKHNPVKISRNELAEYTGRFGPRVITLEGDALYYQRGRQPTQLIPMGKDKFLLEGYNHFRLQFERNTKGQVTGLIGLYQDGRQDKNIREVT